MVLLLVLGRSLLVLIVKVAERIGNLQRLRGGRVEVGFQVEVGSTNEPGGRAWTWIVHWLGNLFDLLEIRFCVKLITVLKCELGRKDIRDGSAAGGHRPCKWGFEDALHVVRAVLWSGNGETTSANFDGWKMSVCGAGFAHGDVLDG
jgi:hypothetical protein